MQQVEELVDRFGGHLQALGDEPSRLGIVTD